MNRGKRLTTILVAVSLLIFFINATYARGGVFIIEPTQEVIEKVELEVPDEVVGNISVSNGLIDFYVRNPSGILLFCYNNTAFETFNFTAEENGNYTIHLANTNMSENVTVTLEYGIHFYLVLHGEIKMTFNVGATTSSMTMVPITPFDYIIEFFKDSIIPNIPILGVLTGFVKWLVNAIRKFWRERKWKKKYKEIRTPSDIKSWISCK
jgi:hypothetical protein